MSDSTPVVRPARLAELVALVVILLLGAHLRVQAVFGTAIIEPVRADAFEYVSYAINLRTLGVYSREPTWTPGHAEARPDAHRPPAYPLFLALWLDDVPTLEALRRIELAQAALGVISVLLAWLLVRRLLSWAAALVVAALHWPLMVAALIGAILVWRRAADEAGAARREGLRLLALGELVRHAAHRLRAASGSASA